MVAAIQRKRVRTLALLVGVLPLIVFAPTVKWVLLRVTATNPPLRVSTLELPVPRTWMVQRAGPRIGGWKPCMTMFCTSPAATFQVGVDEALASHDIWLLAAKATLKDRHYSEPTARRIHGQLGNFDCLEAYRTDGGGMVSTCVGPNGIAATLEGKPLFLGDFYRMLTGATVASR